MDANRWQRVEAIFNEAVARPAAERERFVRESCAGDDGLVADVMALLAADSAPHSLLDGRAIDAVEPARDAPDEHAVAGTVIGPYRLVERIGAGGMGAVYLAERADGQFEQRVALKLIKRGMDSDAILARFRAERSILARLQHANIARLLDGGVTDDGLPYFTMEYVDGLPITDYCERHRLAVHERLGIFLSVCEAVQYAHANLVVHRDLKPGNILVTADGSVKLLDFGIARVLDDTGVGLTRSGQRMMTPAYASPEQVRGEPVTTASDVYALGVVLYELLSGRHPYRDANSTPADIERAIVETNPERPSRFAARLDRDLDTICLVALRKEPERRYASVSQLGDDVRRHLAGRPVSARSDTFRYRFSKFVRRNRVAVSAGALLMLLIAALTLFYTARLARERDLARLEARKAAEVSRFLTGLFSAADPYESRGETVTAREMLDRGLERARTELAGQPRVRAEMLTTIGQAYRNLGLFDQARTALTEALELQRTIYTKPHADVVEAMLALVALDNETGDYPAAVSHAREAVVIARTPGIGGPQLADALALLGESLNYQGKFEEAESLYRESIAAWAVIEGPKGPEASGVMNNLALLLHERSRYAEAEPLFKDALAVQEREFGKRHPETATTRYNYAQLLADEGQLDAARAMWDEVLATDRALYPSGHPNIAFTLSAYGRLLARMGEYKRAEELQREALDIRRSYHGESNSDVAYSLGALGRVVFERGRYPEAESLCRQSLAMHRALNPKHQIAGNMMNDIGNVLYERGDYAGAEAMHREALAFLKSVAGDHPLHAMSVAMSRRARDLAALGRLDEAEPLALAGYDLGRELHQESDIGGLNNTLDYAAIRLQRGAVSAAESLFTDCLEKLRSMEAGEPARPRDISALLGIGRCRLAAADADGAEREFRAALDIARRYFGDRHPAVARTSTALARALMARGNTRDAQPLLRQAVSIFEATVLPAQLHRRDAEAALAECLGRT